MKKLTKKLVSAILSLTMFAALVPSALAAQRDSIAEKQTVYFPEFGLICERTVTNTGEVTVYVRDAATNKISAIAKRENEVVYLNGISLSNLSTTFQPYSETDASILSNSSSAVKWGNWSDWGSADITFSKYLTGAVIAVLAAHAPWLSVEFLGILASLIVVGEIDTVEMKTRIRYGGDDQYSYYERETKFYANGKQLGDTFTDRGKWIEGAGVKSL